MEVQDYLILITSAYAGQPNFNAVVAFNVAPMVQIQQLLTSMVGIFDIDVPPVGNQLDIIGLWVGVSRQVSIPISGVYFTWDSTANVGWDYGIWQGAGQPNTVTELPDDVYLTLIRATIAANQWDGTTNDAYAILDALFAASGVVVSYQDFTNMSYAVVIGGAIIDSLTQALITKGYIKLRPEGVRVTKYYIGDGHPVFAWDLNNTLFQGWDTGHWATEVVPS